MKLTEVHSFLKSEQGSDMVEDALMLAFVVLVGAAAYMGMSNSTNTILSIANSRLAAANNATS